MVVGIKSDGEAYLYDLVNINGVKIEEAPRNRSTTDGDTAVRFGTSSNTTIPKNEDGVNTHSMQNTENNSSNGQKSSLPTDSQAKEEAAAAEKAGAVHTPRQFFL